MSMEGIPQKRPESQEDYKETVGKITVYRHGDTQYTNQYPDLTEEGQAKLENAGKSLKEQVDEETEDLIFFHSPSIRAKASMAHLLHGMEKTSGTEESDVEEVARSFGPLRSFKRFSIEETQKMIDEHIGHLPEEEQMEAFDRVYAVHDDFENSPHWEPRSNSENRAGRLRK